MATSRCQDRPRNGPVPDQRRRKQPRQGSEVRSKTLGDLYSPPVPRRSTTTPHADPLAPFQPATRDWFRSAFDAPTAAQAQGWPAIARGEHTLICAPTGSGKTLAAFLWCLDRLMTEPRPADPPRALRVLYVSPLKALVHDVDRNLRAPLQGISLAAGA